MLALVEFRKQSRNVTWHCVNFVDNLWIIIIIIIIITIIIMIIIKQMQR